MLRSDVCVLIREEPGAHGVAEQVPEVRRQVYCQVRSVGYREVYEAMAHDLHPELVLVLGDCEEYDGERRLEFRGEEWRVIRHYLAGDGRLELTIERRAGK